MLLPGTTYLVTRTTVNRMFLLRPSPFVNDVMLYCIARAALGLRIQIHAISVESNHVHIVLTDLAGDLPIFMRELNRMVAKCLLCHYRKQYPTRTLETFWSDAPYSAVALTTEQSVIDKIAYTLTNPVKDGLVADYCEWPGLNSRPSDWGEAARRAKRPEIYFDQEDDEHAVIEISITVPPMLADWPIEDAVSSVEARVRDVQALWCAQHAEERRVFVGAKAAQRVDPLDAPSTKRARNDLVPRFATIGNADMIRVTKKLLRDFRTAYRIALGNFRAGLAARFPAGTYLMRVFYEVECDCWTPPWCVAALAGPMT